MVWPALRRTIVEISYSRKCRLAFDSIAQCYEAPSKASQHVLDVGGKRRIGIDGVLDLTGGDAEPYRQPENIDQLFAGVSDEMRAEDAVGRLIDDDFRPRDGFRIGSRGKPVVHVIAVHLDSEAVLVGGSLGQADGGKRGDGVDRSRHAAV